jgi:hypothetical protein
MTAATMTTAGQERDADEQEKIAAAIRRIVTPRFIRKQEELLVAPCDEATVRALPLLSHLRPNRVPEAITAHRALIKQVRSDLEDGIANPDHFRLIELLYAYLEASGYRFYYESGRWENHSVAP